MTSADRRRQTARTKTTPTRNKQKTLDRHQQVRRRGVEEIETDLSQLHATTKDTELSLEK
jgi:hypothetical protein